MKKIPTMFKRNPEKMSEILNEPHPDCEWVFDGEGVATRKYDGTSCMIKDGNFFKRREIRKGKKRPENFIESEQDINTGKVTGWMPVDFNNPADQYHAEAFDPSLPDGTYELVGPKVQGNPELVDKHILIKHSDAEKYENVPRDFDGLMEFLEEKNIEGLVFHHPDGRMAKIKKRDFGLSRVK